MYYTKQLGDFEYEVIVVDASMTEFEIRALEEARIRFPLLVKDCPTLPDLARNWAIRGLEGFFGRKHYLADAILRGTDEIERFYKSRWLRSRSGSRASRKNEK